MRWFRRRRTKITLALHINGRLVAEYDVIAKSLHAGPGTGSDPNVMAVGDGSRFTIEQYVTIDPVVTAVRRHQHNEIADWRPT